MTEKKENNENDVANAAQFMIQRIYMKDSSFEAPNTPSIFQQEWQPELSLELNFDHKELEPTVYEVVLTVTATVKNKETFAFLAEVKQAGVFSINGVPKEQLDHLLGSFCPSVLFPYARTVITSHVIQGSFPQLVLAPINFDALYLQKIQEKDKPKEEKTH
ncbi:MAG: protein-export chaperone SecB [Legionellales bacterium RIFCSPHIGHO2_12_FULL_42_9]|nr:MAG: protein-export chaperone SecB [Legionellales bacterium RIFCSPHIGHO2_12_FULL_42_9]